MNLVLASQSPRRQELLRQFGLEFRTVAADVDEVNEGEPAAVVEHNARLKSETVSAQFPDAVTIGADTIVVLNNVILGKPQDENGASKMLRMLSGQDHLVITAVTLSQGGQAVRVFSETTRVRFRELCEHEISSYVASGEPLDKAGAYGIQGFGGLFVEYIEGCYFNVVGLPMPRLVLRLRALGVEVFQ